MLRQHQSKRAPGDRSRFEKPGFLLLALWLLISPGCQSRHLSSSSPGPVVVTQVVEREGDVAPQNPADLHLVQYESEDDAGDPFKPPVEVEPIPESPVLDHVATTHALPELESLASSNNPSLQRLQQRASAAWAKARYSDALPDPTIAANVFGHPIETAAGSQRANLSVMQMIPWLGRLDAQRRQACFNAMAAHQAYEAERVRIIGDLRSAWYKLYLLGKQTEIVEANREIVESLTNLATQRIALNVATPGDVSLGVLELSRLEEQLVTLRQQVASTTAEINRLSGQPAESPVAIPDSIESGLPGWSHDMLRQTAWSHQPQIAEAELRTCATRWGIEVAELKRRPDVSVGASWYLIDNNRPGTPVVDVGRDAWSVGAQVSIPIWREKYDAMRDEATWEHYASHASVAELKQHYDALLRDLWEQAKAANETATLYRETLIPKAEEALEADQEALANNSVDFERVLSDVRTLLALELEHHRALTRLATAIARIEQAVGTDLTQAPVYNQSMPTVAD